MIAAFIVLLTAMPARRRTGLVATAWIEASHYDRFGMVLMRRVR